MSPAITLLGESKCVGLPSSQSSANSSRYLFMGALLRAVGWGISSVHRQAGRPPTSRVVSSLPHAVASSAAPVLLRQAGLAGFARPVFGLAGLLLLGLRGGVAHALFVAWRQLVIQGVMR